MHHSSFFAGVVRSTLVDRGRKNVVGTNKVKAHVTICDGMSPLEVEQAAAKEVADHFAKRGAKMHQAPDEEVAEALKLAAQDLRVVAKLVTRLWCKWPKPPRDLERPTEEGLDRL